MSFTRGPLCFAIAFRWARLLPPCGLVAVVLSAFACSHGHDQGSQNVSPPSPSQAAPSPTSPTPAPSAPAEGRQVRVEMRNVLFHFTDRTVAHIEVLYGEFVPTGTNAMPVMDDKTSFDVRVKSARIAISPDALASIMNNGPFAKSDSPLKDLSMSIQGNKLRIKGKLHSKGDVPFETVGSLSPTKNGRIRVHTEKVKAFKVPVKGLMSVFGIELASVVDAREIDGIDTEKDDLIMDMAKLLPPPHIRGAVTAVSIENNQIVTVFGTLERTPPLETGNYMALRGNQIRFGKVTMQDSDLTVLDLDPVDPLDWNQDRYKDQLIAGYSKITPSFGLRAYVKDYAKLNRGGNSKAKPPGE